MPLHIDVKINDELIERLHIGRFGDTGTQNGELKQYRAVLGQKETLPPEEYTFARTSDFPKEPTFLEWEEASNRFNHRYGDGALVCVLKALEAEFPEHATATQNAARAAELERENEQLKNQVAALQEKLNAPPF